MEYNKGYNPAFAVGAFTVLACLVIMTIFAVTGIIPLALQPPLMMSLLITIIMGGSICVAGYFKSMDRQGYPVLFLVVLIMPLIFVMIWYFTR